MMRHKRDASPTRFKRFPGHLHSASSGPLPRAWVETAASRLVLCQRCCSTSVSDALSQFSGLV